MDNRIITLLLALGVSPSITHAVDILPTPNSDLPKLVIPQSKLSLHQQTQIILQLLKDKGALSIVENENGVHLVIEGDKLDDSFFVYISQFKNVTPIEGTRELAISDSLAAAMAASGELKDVLPKDIDDEELLRELQEKMGPDLDESIKYHSGASFA